MDLVDLRVRMPFSFFWGLAYQGKDIVFRFIIEYSGLMDFDSYIANNRSIFT